MTWFTSVVAALSVAWFAANLCAMISGAIDYLKGKR